MFDPSNLSIEGEKNNYTFYEYDDNNMLINIEVYNEDPNLQNIRGEKRVELSYLSSQYNQSKPPARKGETRKVLCGLLEFILKNKISSINDNTPFYAEPVDINKLGNIEGLYNMYRDMSLNPMNRGKGDPLWVSTVDRVLKWCKIKYAGMELENIGDDIDMSIGDMGETKEDRKKLRKSEEALQYYRETGDIEATLKMLER